MSRSREIGSLYYHLTGVIIIIIDGRYPNGYERIKYFLDLEKGGNLMFPFHFQNISTHDDGGNRQRGVWHRNKRTPRPK